MPSPEYFFNCSNESSLISENSSESFYPDIMLLLLDFCRSGGGVVFGVRSVKELELPPLERSSLTTSNFWFLLLFDVYYLAGLRFF